MYAGRKKGMKSMSSAAGAGDGVTTTLKQLYNLLFRGV